jgi:hypothetical protein
VSDIECGADVTEIGEEPYAPCVCDCGCKVWVGAVAADGEGMVPVSNPCSPCSEGAHQGTIERSDWVARLLSRSHSDITDEEAKRK